VHKSRIEENLDIWDFKLTEDEMTRITKMIQQATGADMEEIETVTPYTGSYDEIVNQEQREVQSGFTPELKPMQKDFASYDEIILGTPTWWYTMAPAVRTFLSQYDLAGKKVVLFQTHGGWPAHCLKDMEKGIGCELHQKDVVRGLLFLSVFSSHGATNRWISACARYHSSLCTQPSDRLSAKFPCSI